MNKSTRLSCAITMSASTALLASTTFAHHAPVVYYDMSKEITMSGTVTEFRMGNPHARIYFDVANADGTSSQWMAEGGSRTVMLRRGWTGEEVNMGDTVTLSGHPSRSGDNIMHMVDVELSDGTSKFAEDTDPTAINQLLERRRQRE